MKKMLLLLLLIPMIAAIPIHSDTILHRYYVNVVDSVRNANRLYLWSDTVGAHYFNYQLRNNTTLIKNGTATIIKKPGGWDTVQALQILCRYEHLTVIK